MGFELGTAGVGINCSA